MKNKQLIQYGNKEQGVVSIISVIFFIILMSIVTISFLRIVTDQQQQVIDDDLSKGALASAQSGVEDAKRLLLRCRALSGSAQTDCFAALENQTCPGIFALGSPQVGALGLNQQPDGSIKVGDPASNQRYTCVTMSRETTDYVGTLPENGGDFIPLRSVSPFNQIRFSWHIPGTSSGQDGAGAIPPAGAIELNRNPSKADWHTTGANPVSYIAMPRLQLVEFDPNKTLSELKDSSSGLFLVPNQGGSASYDINAVNSGGVQKRAAIKCNNPDTVAGYMCTATLNLKFSMPATNQYYLLVRSQYGTPHYKVELLRDGIAAPLDDVQPIVDSTGAAGNVYKRVLTRVSYRANGFFTTNAIESGTSVCKNFFVTANFYQNECGALGENVGGPLVGNAGIGGYCDVNVCFPSEIGAAGGGDHNPDWSTTMANTSSNPRNIVTGCKWDFGDGTQSDDHCFSGDSFSHTFPRDPAYDTNPNLPRKPYNVHLEIFFKDGTKSSDDRTFSMPENYP